MHVLLFILGLAPYPDGTPWTYQLWSGFVPALAVLSLFGGVAAHLKLINCHVHRCPRLGRYPVAGGKFKVCAKHSPHPDRPTHEHILCEHARHEDGKS